MPERLRRAARVLAVLLLTVVCVPALALTVSVPYAASDEELHNPFIGNAVWANDDSSHDQAFTLVYANLTWADFEPEQGQYAFAAFEKENQFEHWRAEGKRLILRFVLDEPTGKKHRDIPDWLYKAMDKDGTAYSIPYGRGFSPNYENPVLIQAHAEAVAALGARYGNDPFVAFVELGSIGHWGEWHIYEDISSMPPDDVLRQYVTPYVEAFPDTFLLMRRPFAAAAEFGLGLFNDTAAEPKSTETWLGWIANGGTFETTDGDGAIVPMPDAWQTAPIGGELSTQIDREELLITSLEQTLSLFRRSHTSWVGPGSFADVERNCAMQPAVNEVNRLLGYRLRVARCDIQQTGEDIRITLLWENDGIAPFYYGWQAVLALVDEQGTETRVPLKMELIDILPDQPLSVSLTLPLPAGAAGAYTLWVGILDPDTGEPGVALAMKAPQRKLWYELVTVDAP